MATKTPNLNLVLPANGEFFNTWDQPNNNNFKLIDTAVGAVTDEVEVARGNAQDLNTRLSAAMDANGNPLPTPEVAVARVSSVYGGFTPGAVAFQLNDRLEVGDREVFTARQGLSALIDGLAWGPDQNKNDSVLSAATNFLTFTGNVVSLNGSVTPLIANINGYRQKVRTIQTTPITGGSGTFYLTLTRNVGGSVFFTSSGGTGTVNAYPANSLVAMLSDISQNFITLGVKPGDIINITGPVGNPNINSFVVLATNNEDPTNLTTSDLAIVGQFNSVSTGLNYTITDPLAPTLGFTPTAQPKSFTRSPNKIYIGRCVFDGTNVTSLTIYQNMGIYADFTSVSLTLGNYSLSVAHNLGFFPKRVSVFGSQANDFSQPLQPLSAECVVQVDDTTFSIKNSANGVFYVDFGGTTQTSGFLYVVVER